MLMTFPVSENVASMSTSSTMKAAAKAAALREQGVDVIDLTLGEPDFATPEFIRDYAVEGLQKGYTKYTPSTGLKLFQNAIAEFYRGQFGADIDPSTIVASCGGKQALLGHIPRDRTLLRRKERPDRHRTF